MIRDLVPDLAKEAVRAVREQRQRFRVWRQYGSGESVLAAALGLARLSILPKRTILFYPSLPNQWQIVYKLCLFNGYRMINDSRKPHDLIHKHDKETTSSAYELVLDLVRDGKRAINAGSNDISKSRVQRVFAEVFEYQLEVDPSTHKGKAVKKSDANYRHDGVIVECPFEPEDEKDVVYQRLIETENEEGLCIDFRVPFYGGEIPLVYLKYRPKANRFKTYIGGRIMTPESVFSPDEIGMIGRYAERMGLDFGEMDVLRDNEDGRIYIVDVNNTPAGPPDKLDAGQQRMAVALLASAYQRLVEAHTS